MINLTRLMEDALGQPAHPDAAATEGVRPPLVVFHLTRRCNLGCRHCYIDAADRAYARELTQGEIKTLIDDCQRLGVPAILFSGGEPLLSSNLPASVACAKERGLRVGVSTNGTLIRRPVAAELARCGVDYVGVSIDGMRSRHDAFRNHAGAFDAAWAGIIHCLEQGIKTGVRFTLHRDNAADLEALLDMCVREKIPRFCLYHLVYAGRGEALQHVDISNEQRRMVVTALIETSQRLSAAGSALEILTVDNHADGIFLYQRLRRRDPALAARILDRLAPHGGCSAGTKFVDVSPEGEVYPCQFWQQESLGNLRVRGLADLWQDESGTLLCRLRHKADALKGRCGRCRFKFYCGGCRVRAAVVYNDFWAEDPCCYLTEAEIS